MYASPNPMRRSAAFDCKVDPRAVTALVPIMSAAMPKAAETVT